MFKGASWIIPGPDWFANVQNAAGNWPYNGAGDWVGGPCETAWPPGWGGTVTDSLLQETLAMDPVAGMVMDKVFVQSIATNGGAAGIKLPEVNDVVSFWICGDGGVSTAAVCVGNAAYPDICCLECSGLGWTIDWEIAIDAGETPSCVYLHAPNNGAFVRNPELRKPYARHLGGVNAGFLDGHASWMLSQVFINRYAEGELVGIEAWSVEGAAAVLACGYCDPADFDTLW
jgi:prepilin-type processing-associated H-X9-DG protein